MLRISAIALVTLGIGFVGTSTAEGGHGWGGHGCNYGGYGGYGGVYSAGYGGGYGHTSHYAPSYGGWSHGGPQWHDTSHLDYHAPSLRWHGNHIDFVPGHYDVHHSGHWDW